MTKCINSSLLALLLPAIVMAAPAETRLQYQSAFMRVEVAPDQPALVALAVDSLGKNKLSVDAMTREGSKIVKIPISSRALGALTLVLAAGSAVQAQETLQSALHAKLQTQMANVVEHLNGV